MNSPFKKHKTTLSITLVFGIVTFFACGGGGGSSSTSETITQPNYLDTSFGLHGRVILGLGDGCSVNAIAVQSDGKIIIAGSVIIPGGDHIVVARFNIDGSLDTSFSADGYTITQFDASNSDIANAIAIQHDGRILVGGSAYSGGYSSNFALVRYNNNGDLDNTFGIDGKVVTNMIPGKIKSIALQPDGKIVATGEIAASGTFPTDFTIIRYNSNGTIDTSFATAGILTTAIVNPLSVSNSIAIQNDGKVLASGYAYDWNRCDFAAIRCLSDGSLDGSFGTGGIVTTDVSDKFDNGTCMKILDNGSFIIGGYANRSSLEREYLLVKYTQNGALDNTFGINGKVINAPNGNYNDPACIGVQHDGKIILIGRSITSTGVYFNLTRYLPNGEIEVGFGNNGTLLTSFADSTHSAATSMTIQEDGKILIAGYSYASDSKSRFAIARYIP